METVKASSPNAVAQRLRQLVQLYQQGQASALVEQTLDKLLAHEAEVCRTQLSQLESDLAAFEQQYDISSAEFYRRFQAGQTDDRMDCVEWVSLVQMQTNLKQRLQLLTDESQSLS